MKKSLRLMMAASKILDFEKFYSAEASATGVRLQGHYKHDLAEFLVNNKFKFQELAPSGYLYFMRGNISITLT